MRRENLRMRNRNLQDYKAVNEKKRCEAKKNKMFQHVRNITNGNDTKIQKKKKKKKKKRGKKIIIFVCGKEKYNNNKKKKVFFPFIPTSYQNRTFQYKFCSQLKCRHL